MIYAILFLIIKCYFIIGNLELKQDIGIPMEIDPAPMWAHFFLHLFESKYVQQLISKGSAYNFDGTSRLIGDLCTAIDDSQFLHHTNISIQAI